MPEHTPESPERVSVLIAPAGAYSVIQTKRIVRIYQVQKRELQMLGRFNGILAAGCSTASAAAAFGANILWSLVPIQDATTIRMGHLFVYVCGFVVVAGCGVAFWAHRVKGTELKAILRETEDGGEV